MSPADAGGAKPAPSNIAVIVTGAARGMGRAMTLALAAAGVRVAAADLASSRNEMREVLDIARRQGVGDRIISVECDIARWQDCTGTVQTAIDRFGALHGLVNNAGIAVPDEELASGRARRRRFYQHDTDAWRRVIDTNVTGSFQMAKAIAPTLVAQGWGRIVNVTTSATTMVLEGFSPYGPSKAALEAATVIWSKDLAHTGVTVNALVPGGPGNTRMVPHTEAPDRATLVQPEAMMAPIVWLMSAQSDGITGRHFVAKLWDANLDPSAAAEKAGAPAGWS
jgi:NAD(P)-dependent dehydrogenase (short-subunit alcohol dehydrogenase family)